MSLRASLDVLTKVTINMGRTCWLHLHGMRNLICSEGANRLLQNDYAYLPNQGVTWSPQRIPTAVNFGVLDRCRYFLEKTPQLLPRGRVDPVPDPLLLKKKIW
jgi:hypothetical protein